MLGAEWGLDVAMLCLKNQVTLLPIGIGRDEHDRKAPKIGIYLDRYPVFVCLRYGRKVGGGYYQAGELHR